MILTQQQICAAAALGLDPRTLVWSPEFPSAHQIATATQRKILQPELISDADWQAMVNSGALPLEPAQSDALDNRMFVAAVFAVVGQSKAWVDLDPRKASPEACRKKFSRWAHKGIWEALHAHVVNASPELKKRLQAVRTRSSGLRRSS